MLRWLVIAWLTLGMSGAWAMVCMLPVATETETEPPSMDDHVERTWFTSQGLLLRTESGYLLAQSGPDATGQATYKKVRVAGTPVSVREVVDAGSGVFILAISTAGDNMHAVYQYASNMEEPLLIDVIDGEASFYVESDRAWLLARSGIYPLQDREPKTKPLQGINSTPLSLPSMFGSGDQLFLSVKTESGREALYRVKGENLLHLAEWSGEPVIGFSELGEAGFFFWTVKAIYRLDGNNQPLKVVEHPGVLTPSEICPTVAGNLVLYPDGPALLEKENEEDVLKPLDHERLGAVQSVHPYSRERTTLVAARGVFDLHNDRQLENNLDDIEGVYQSGLSVDKALFIRDRDGKLHLRDGNKHEKISLPKDQSFAEWWEYGGRLWLRTKQGLYLYNKPLSLWEPVAGNLDKASLKLIPSNSPLDSVCPNPGENPKTMSPGPLNLLISDGETLARLHNAPLNLASLELNPAFSNAVIAPSEADKVSWRIDNFPCQEIPGAAQLVA